MEKVKGFLAQVIAIATGFGFWGLSLLGWALLAFWLDLNFVAWGLIGAFVGKNLQAIKTALNSIKF